MGIDKVFRLLVCYEKDNSSFKKSYKPSWIGKVLPGYKTTK